MKHLKNTKIYKEPKKTEPVSLQNALLKVMKSYQMEDRFLSAKIETGWKDLMGGTIAQRTSKIFVKSKKLYIELTSAPLKAELMHSKERILSLVHEYLGQPYLKDIVFL